MPDDELVLPKEFEKLTPEERVKKLKEMQQILEDKKKKEIEMQQEGIKKLLEKTDKVLKDKRLKDIKEQVRLQELFKKKQKEESLEDIAETAPKKEEEEHNENIQRMYLSMKYAPVQQLDNQLSAITARVEEKGYINPEELEQTRAIGYVLMRKEGQETYQSSEQMQMMLDRTKKKKHALESMYEL